ncbi:hypothetical protein [Streptomyces sp. NPDC002044]|uniref:hypothetical protein n=1 Tax=Streptomyces sp. NPDC002044 TaxID=3154662 RepID=UPI0033281CBF
MPTTPDAVGTVLGELVANAAADQGGALWRLRDPGRQLDANVVRLPPGAEVAPHTEADLDVLLVVVAGTGHLTLDGAGREVSRGSLTVLPRGASRALSAGPDGLVYLTAHRRRPGMGIGHRPRTDAAAPCALHLVCGQCHRHAIEADARFCGRCGTPLKRRTQDG